jgi:predicted protein tyrosine phosphatase
MKHVLFIFSRNRLRSPTAERVFSAREGFEVASAGLDSEAEMPVSSDLLEWADVIFVMERAHRNKLAKKFKPHLKSKRVICLDIPDEFEFWIQFSCAFLRRKRDHSFSAGDMTLNKPLVPTRTGEPPVLAAQRVIRGAVAICSWRSAT